MMHKALRWNLLMSATLCIVHKAFRRNLMSESETDGILRGERVDDATLVSVKDAYYHYTLQP